MGLTPIRYVKAFQSYKPPSFSVFGVVCISPAGNVLLVQGKRTGIWSFPKGHLKPSETAIECALRELREETGVVLSQRAPFLYRKLAAASYFFVEADHEFVVSPEDTAEVGCAVWMPVKELGSIRGNIDVESFRRQGLARLWEESNEVLQSEAIMIS